MHSTGANPSGDAAEADAQGTIRFPLGNLGAIPQAVHDVFLVTLATTTDLSLQASGTGVLMVLASADPGTVGVRSNVSSSGRPATIRATVPPGTYHIGLWANSTAQTRTPYQLSVVAVPPQ